MIDVIPTLDGNATMPAFASLSVKNAPHIGGGVSPLCRFHTRPSIATLSKGGAFVRVIPFNCSEARFRRYTFTVLVVIFGGSAPHILDVFDIKSTVSLRYRFWVFRPKTCLCQSAAF
jgi:hypothetical protein